MKKSILIMLLLLLCFPAAASADIITVQGEDYKSVSGGTPIIKPDGAEDPVMILSEYWPKGKSITVTYEFEAEATGGYEITAATSKIDDPYTSNFYYSVNEGEQVYCGNDFTKLSVPGSSYTKDTYLYSLGICELKQGKNTISFTVDEPRETTGNWVIFYMDKFMLEKQEFSLYSVTASKPAAVFENSDRVEFTVLFSDYPDEEKSYTAVIEDFYHNRKGAVDFKVSQSELKKRLDFGVMQQGWYRLIISDGAENIYNSGFSVTHDRALAKYNPHFATDFASFALVKSGKTEIEGYCRALSLAGIDTVRERYYWGNYAEQKGSYNTTAQKYQNDTLKKYGLKVLNMFCSTPSWAQTTGFLADDLFDVYGFQKHYAENLSGRVDFMEIWNEEDTAFASETADVYAAFLKAAAIGINDGNANMGKMFGGFAQHPGETDYMDLCMMNDIMEYSDIYSYHAYASGGNSYDEAPSLLKEELRENRDILTAYGIKDKRSWVTEGGISLYPINERSRSQQAKAAVINNVQSVANGNDKHFLFIIPQYAESGREFGMFCADKTPTPSYTALENLTFQLGQAEYKGVFRDIADDTFGYLFDNGENDTGVFWRKTGTGYIQVPAQQGVTVCDMMGNERRICASSGLAGIKIGTEPIYVQFEEAVPEKYYLREKKEKPVYNNAEISDNKRIVIQQKFESKNYNEEQREGYLMRRDQDNICTLKVYNFSDNAVSGRINARVSEGFVLDASGKELSIAPMDHAEVSFVIRTNVDRDTSVKGFLEFSGVMNGGEITKSVSVIRCMKPEEVNLAGVFKNAESAGNWHTSGAVIAGGSVRVSGEGEMTFSVELPGSNGWSYPSFDFKKPQGFENSKGLMVSVAADEDLRGTILHSTIYMKDGRKYFEGSSKGKTIKSEYTTYYFPWDEMVCMHRPEGVDPEIGFDISDIAYISFGVNLTDRSSVTYRLKDIGWYIQEPEKSIPREDITFCGIQDGAVYYKGHAGAVTAVLPVKDTIKNVKVYLSEAEYTDLHTDGNCVIINLNALEKGSYTLLVTAENEFGYMYKESADFVIQ